MVLCVSAYSGRCLISNYMLGRDAKIRAYVQMHVDTNTI